jgi:hypothetical protein
MKKTKKSASYICNTYLAQADSPDKGNAANLAVKCAAMARKGNK